MGDARADAIENMYLFAAGLQLTAAATNEYATAFQLAVWEIVHDFDAGLGLASLNITGGLFRATKTDGSSLSGGVLSHLSTFFTAAAGAAPRAKAAAASWASPAARPRTRSSPPASPRPARLPWRPWAASASSPAAARPDQTAPRKGKTSTTEGPNPQRLTNAAARSTNKPFPDAPAPAHAPGAGGVLQRSGPALQCVRAEHLRHLGADDPRLHLCLGAPSLLGRIAAWVFLLVVLLVVFFLLLPLLIVLAVLAALAEGLRSLFRRGWPGRAATDDDGRKNVRIARHDPDQDVRG